MCVDNIIVFIDWSSTNTFIYGYRNQESMSKKNLQSIEWRSGTFVESVAKQSEANAAHDVFQKEMRFEFYKYKDI